MAVAGSRECRPGPHLIASEICTSRTKLLGNIDSQRREARIDSRHRLCCPERMRNGPAFSVSVRTAILLAALAVGGCGSSAADSPSAGGSSAAAGARDVGAGRGGGVGTAGGPGTSGGGGSGAGAATAGASNGGATSAGASSGGATTAGASGSGGQGSAGMSALACPATVPATGASCSTPGVCNYSDCGGAGLSTATCDGVTFSVTASPCQAVPCGTTGSPPHALSCMPNEICVSHQAGNSWFECRPDPCAPGAEACGCASALCGSPSNCSFQNFKLICSCTGICA